MTLAWYTLRSKPRKEDTVWQQLVTQGYNTFYPRLRVQPINPRARKFAPYFPGYLFLQADLEQAGCSTFQWMPHTLGLVNFGGEPACVPEHLILALQTHLDAVNRAGGDMLHGLRAGDRVWITDGPFTGFEAIFDARIPGSDRVRVLLEFLSNRRQVAVTLRAGQIQTRKLR